MSLPPPEPGATPPLLLPPPPLRPACLPRPAHRLTPSLPATMLLAACGAVGAGHQRSSRCRARRPTSVGVAPSGCGTFGAPRISTCPSHRSAPPTQTERERDPTPTDCQTDSLHWLAGGSGYVLIVHGCCSPSLVLNQGCIGNLRGFCFERDGCWARLMGRDWRPTAWKPG